MRSEMYYSSTTTTTKIFYLFSERKMLNEESFIAYLIDMTGKMII